MQPGRPGPDDENIAKAMGVVVTIRIGLPRSLAHAGGFADQLFVAHPKAGAASPFEGRQAHEGLVVKAGGEEAAEHAGDRADVVAHRRPGVLSLGDQPLIQFLGRRLDIGFMAIALADRDDRTGSPRRPPT